MISIGLDVGQNEDPAALAVLNTIGVRECSHRPQWRAVAIGNIERGTPYQELVKLLVGVARDFTEAGYAVVATIDATGIGGAIVELAHTQAPELHIVAVTIGAARTLTHAAPDEYVVGKHRLTEVLQVALEQRGLDIPASIGTDELRTQLQRFVRKPTRSGYQKHEADSGHDDLVLALELALWTGDMMFDQQAGVPL